MVFIISIDGNIGAGKTTLIKQLDKDPFILTITEPVEEWEDLLFKVTINPKKYAFILQQKVMNFYKNVNIFIDLNKNRKDIKFIIVERSACTALSVFSKYYLDQKALTQKQYKRISFLYQKYSISFNYHLLIVCNPSICLKHIKKRNKDYERTLSLKFLKHLHLYQMDMYKITISKKNTKIVNNNATFKHLYHQVLQFLNQLNISVNE